MTLSPAGGMTVPQFQEKWRNATLSERAGSQSHFNDLCRLLSVPTPTDADPAGHFYTFERGAEKSGGGKGWADVWFRGHFAWEYKGHHANLKKAYDQLLQYREDLENPPLLVVCDLDRFEIHTNFTGAAKKVYAFALDGAPVQTINSDLTSVLDLTLVRPLLENRGIAFIGDQPTGPFDIDTATAERWLNLPTNPNGRTNRDVLRPFVNAIDLTARRPKKWIVDFGVNMPQDAAALYEAPFEHVREHVRPERARNRVARLRDIWWLHWNPRPQMREALKGLDRYVATPIVANIGSLCGWQPKY